MKTPLIKPLSVKQYALLFTVAITLLFTGFGVFTYYGVEELKLETRVSARSVSDMEMRLAIKDVVAEYQAYTAEYAQWEEIRQQIGNPLYYTYWKRHRSLAAGNLPEHALDTAVYDAAGKALAILDTSLLPDAINPSSLEPYADIQNNQLQLVTVEPVEAGSWDGSIIGYVAMRSDIRPHLIETRQFYNIDGNSIALTEVDQKHLLIADLPGHISFELRSSPVLENMMGIVIRTLILVGAASVILTLLFYPLVTYLIAKPLTQLSQHIDRLKENSTSTALHSLGNRLPVEELEKVRTSLNEYHFKLHEVHDNLDESNKQLWRLAHHDALTGTLNRRAFDEYLDNLSEFLADSRSEICLAIFDIDHFKAINDTYGHQVGDDVIKAIAQSISSVLRDDDRLYRLGGDEFAVVFVDHDSVMAMSVAERCQLKISNYPFQKLGIREPVRISIGISHASAAQLEQLADIQWQADVAMYSAKQPVNASIAVFSENMAAGARGLFSSQVPNAVYEAIADGTGLEVFYQPIHNLENGEVSYYEALLRIMHDDEIIMPLDIFRFVETKQLEREMDYAILRKIYSDLENGIIPEGSGVSINISGPSIVQPETVEMLAGFMDFAGRYKLILEVTETALITQIEEASENLEVLQSMGFLIALDDFGSGYSSVSYLANMPIDIVKFDISLIRCLDIKKQRVIVEHLARMIIATGHLLVAEGIETEKARDDVIDMGFNFGQGYLFGKPKSMSETEQPVIKQAQC